MGYTSGITSPLLFPAYLAPVGGTHTDLGQHVTIPYNTKFIFGSSLEPLNLLVPKLHSWFQSHCAVLDSSFVAGILFCILFTCFWLEFGIVVKVGVVYC